jgi:hypothetical protein
MAEPASAPSRHAWPADGCCANCHTALAGNWCHHCGQRAHDHHHALAHLAAEAVEGLTHADGRLWRTLSLLVLHPARLTLDYLHGHRVSEIPPLRLFFVMLLLVFATGSMPGDHTTMFKMSGTELAHAHTAINTIALHGWPRLSAWLRLHLGHALDDPRGLTQSMREWGERFAFLLLPLAALSLRLLFATRRDLTLYDHLVFTMHSLSFAGLVWVTMQVLDEILGLPARLLVLVLPVHLFVHMRGVYHTAIFATLARMAALFVFSMLIFVLLLASLALVSIGTLEV